MGGIALIADVKLEGSACACVCGGVVVIGCVRKGVCAWDSPDCCRNVCVCVKGRESRESVCVDVCVGVCVGGCRCDCVHVCVYVGVGVIAFMGRAGGNLDG